MPPTIDIYAGEPNGHWCAFVEPVGRYITDLVLSSSTTVTSVTAGFTAADTGKMITAPEGGITDGTTMTYVSPSTVTLSAAATVTAVGVKALVRALNMSAFTSPSAMFRTVRNAPGAPLVTATVTGTRSAYGLFRIAWTAADADLLVGSQARTAGVWDLQTTYGGAPRTIVKDGTWACRKDTTR